MSPAGGLAVTSIVVPQYQAGDAVRLFQAEGRAGSGVLLPFACSRSPLATGPKSQNTTDASDAPMHNGLVIGLALFIRQITEHYR